MKTALAILFIALALVVGTIRAAAVQMEGRRLLTTESTFGRKAKAGGTISTVGNKSADCTNNKEINNSEAEAEAEAEAETSDDNEKNESRRENDVDSDGNSHHQYNSVNPPDQSGAKK